jgi:hypothetical protein
MSDVRPHSPRQVLLGLFILFQLGFMIVANLLGFIKWAPTEATDKPKALINRVAPGFADKQRHGWYWTEELETNLRRYAQLTGQDQNWSLFAPGVAKATGFPAVVLLFDDPPESGPSIPGAILAFDKTNGFNVGADWKSLPLRAEMLLSENEPLDIHAYIRVGKCRLRRYESQFYINPQPNENESPDDLAARLTRRMRRLINEYHDPTFAYVKWRHDTWKRDHPDEPAPKQVLLVHRLYRIHGPEEEPGWDGPLLIPMFRWQPDAKRSDNQYPLEAFDFTEQRFTPVSR